MRAHTISHPEPAHLPEFNLPAAVTTTTQPRHHHHEEDLPVTPRYSFEFPSHVPHHIHIEEHQRARAQYAMWATTNTPLSSSSSLPVASPNVIHDDTGLIPPHIPQMHGRSYSQPYNNYHSTQIESSSSPFRSSLNSTHGESINVSPIRLREQGQTQGRLGVRARARASTIGESSRLLIQRMQALTKKPFSVSRSAATSGQSSLNADPMDDLLSSEATTSVPTLVTAVSVPEVSVSVPEVSVSMPDVSVSAAETLAREPETCILQQEEDEGSDGSPTATVEAGHEHEESGCIITPAIQVFQSETLDHSCRQTILVPSDSSSSSLTSEVLPIGSMSAIITVS
ncbi:hypothetical protein BX616_005325 [Lobosporangium transversale]|nr:hypothetical protein BX616_005325 [Lobosporangium transversale]